MPTRRAACPEVLARVALRVGASERLPDDDYTRRPSRPKLGLLMLAGSTDRNSWAEALLMAQCDLVTREGRLSAMLTKEVAPVRTAVAHDHVQALPERGISIVDEPAVVRVTTTVLGKAKRRILFSLGRGDELAYLPNEG